MKIKDSGSRRTFGTGAVRDMAEGKGRCDLMPLEELGAALGDTILHQLGIYVHEGRLVMLELVVSEFLAGQHKYETLLELSKYYEQGALSKYGERNWEKGLPISTYIDSGVRHYFKFKAGQTDERHDLAFLWNILGALWTHRHKPEMQDLPFAKGVKEG